MTAASPSLSKVRSLMFVGLACVWFGEMLFMGFPSLSRVWAAQWQVVPPEDPQLQTALFVMWASAAPAKGALFVLAVAGLLSSRPSVRTALYASMALVPPLNFAFPFRQQGFLLRPVMIATVLSTLLWGSFLLFRERTVESEEDSEDAREQPPSAWEIVQYIWFAVYSAALTLMAVLLIFQPRVALNLVLPCLSSTFGAHEREVSSLIHTGMASGTHLLALAVACWIATARSRSSPALRNAVALAGTVHSGLFLVFPLTQIGLGFGTSCATASVLAVSVPFLAGWLLYAAVSYRGGTHLVPVHL